MNPYDQLILECNILSVLVFMLLVVCICQQIRWWLKGNYKR
jgi:hypothetical protein